MNRHGGFVEIGVGHDDDCVFAAHLASDFGAALCRFDVKRAADFIRAGERDGPEDRRMNHRFADDGSGADEHIEHAGRKSGFFVNFREEAAVAGVSSAGLKITVFPATRAGALSRFGDKLTDRRYLKESDERIPRVQTHKVTSTEGQRRERDRLRHRPREGQAVPPRNYVGHAPRDDRAPPGRQPHRLPRRRDTVWPATWRSRTSSSR